MKGYKNVLIRGGWCSGDVLACFEDPVVIGSIQENTYDPNYKIFRDPSKGGINVIGVPKVYKGTEPEDKRIKGVKENFSGHLPTGGCGNG